MLVYNPRSFYSKSVYRLEPFKNLEYLATLTNGFFATPFKWDSAELESTDGVEKVIIIYYA